LTGYIEVAKGHLPVGHQFTVLQQAQWVDQGRAYLYHLCLTLLKLTKTNALNEH